METKNKVLEYSFIDHKFPDIVFDKCSIIHFDPSQSDKIVSNKHCTFVLVSEGKGSISHLDRRISLTASTGIALPPSSAITLKADNIEPFTVICISVHGEATKSLISMIDTRENGVIMNLGNGSRILGCAKDLITECSKSYISDYSVLVAFYDFLSSIYENYTEKKLPSKNVYMIRATDYIKQNYNKNISVEDIANMLGIERSYLSRLFKTYKNKSTQNYIIDYRIRQAKRLFEEEDMNVSQVCAAVGYTNIYCFSRIFKSRVGMPPKEYMEKCRQKNVISD